MEEFKRTADSPEMVSAYDSEGLHLVFDNDGRLKQVTVFTPNEANLGSTQLLGEPIEAARAAAMTEGFVFEEVDAGLWCEQSGVLLIDVDGIVDGVEVHEGR